MTLIIPIHTSTSQEENADSIALLQSQHEISELKTKVAYWYAEAKMWQANHTRAKEREELQKQEIKHLKAKLRLRERQLFGRKTEKQKSSNQQKHPGNENKTKRERGQQKDNPGPNRRNFSHLEERIEIIDLPESEKYCQCCGSFFSDTGMTSDSKLLEIEVKAHVRLIKRKQYRTNCACQKKSILTANRIHKIIPKSILADSIWAHLLVEKYGYGTPLNRLMKSLSLSGLNLSQGTVTGGVHRLKPFLEPVFEAIKEKSLTESNWNGSSPQFF